MGKKSIEKVKEIKDLLDEMAKAKTEIQSIQFWVDGARINRIVRIRYKKAKDKLKKLIIKHKILEREWLTETVTK